MNRRNFFRKSAGLAAIISSPSILKAQDKPEDEKYNACLFVVDKPAARKNGSYKPTSKEILTEVYDILLTPCVNEYKKMLIFHHKNLGLEKRMQEIENETDGVFQEEHLKEITKSVDNLDYMFLIEVKHIEGDESRDKYDLTTTIINTKKRSILYRAPEVYHPLILEAKNESITKETKKFIQFPHVMHGNFEPHPAILPSPDDLGLPYLLWKDRNR